MLIASLALVGIGTPPRAAEPPPPEPVTQPLKDAVTQAIRNCPSARNGEIAICARDRGFAERYRIERLTKPVDATAESKVKLSGVGGAVPGDCTTIGQAGVIGCSKRDYEAWAAERRRRQAEAGVIP